MQHRIAIFTHDTTRNSFFLRHDCAPLHLRLNVPVNEIYVAEPQTTAALGACRNPSFHTPNISLSRAFLSFFLGMNNKDFSILYASDMPLCACCIPERYGSLLTLIEVIHVSQVQKQTYEVVERENAT